MKVTVAGGSGYIGALLCAELIGQDHQVTALDALIHGQDDVAAQIEAEGVELIRADIRDPEAREKALTGSDALVHLAAIVGDPACARDPEFSEEVNVEGTPDDRGRQAPWRRARRLRLDLLQLWPHGRPDHTDRRDRRTPPRLPLRGAEGRHREDAARRHTPGFSATCLRFATVYGVAPRMRFDLTVNEFTRDLWAGRKLEVFGEFFWRPYIHVADAARAVALVLSKPTSEVASEVFNAGHSDENYRKLDLVELILQRLGRGDVEYVSRDEDPRDYKVSFEKIEDRLGFAPKMRVPDGIDEIVVALEAESSPTPSPRATRTSDDPRVGPAHPALRHRARRGRDRGRRGDAALRLADDGPADRASSRSPSPSTSTSSTRSPPRAAPPPSTSPTWPPGSDPATRSSSPRSPSSPPPRRSATAAPPRSSLTSSAPMT